MANGANAFEADGLNSMNYKIRLVERKCLYTWIVADVRPNTVGSERFTNVFVFSRSMISVAVDECDHFILYINILTFRRGTSTASTPKENCSYSMICIDVLLILKILIFNKLFPNIVETPLQLTL